MDKRYKKRIDNYWMKMEAKSLDAINSRDINGWFDYWHTHPDWDGKGNKCFQNRVSAAELTYKLLLHLEKLCNKRNEPIQCWATISEDTADNAIFLHTENENNTAFPYKYDNTEWENFNLPEYLDCVNSQTHEIGSMRHLNEIIYNIRRKA